MQTATPPVVPLTEAVSFGRCITGEDLFTVKPGICIVAALTHASELLLGAIAVAVESAENATEEYRPLARSLVHPVEEAKALVESALAALERMR